MDIGQLWVTLGVDASGLNKGAAAMLAFQKTTQASVDKVAASLERTSNEFQRFGSAANRYLTLPLTLLGGVAAKVAMDLDFIAMKIVNLANTSQAQMDAWQSSITSLSTATTVSAKQIAETLYYVASAGIKSKEAMEIVEIAAKAQASGMGKIEDVGRMLTYALNAYGKENLTAAHAADALTVAVREGTAEAGSLVAVIGDVIPVAAQMGVEFDQVVGSLAAMTRTGFNAHKAATALRQIMVALLHPTNQAEDAMKRMGTSGAELRDIMKNQSLIEALVKIDNLSSKFGEEIVGQVFGNVRALTGDLSLVGKNLLENLEILRKTKTEIGTFEKLFTEAAKTSKFSWDEVKNTANQAMIAMGQAILPSLIKMFDYLNGVLKDLADWFRNLSTSAKENIATFGMLLIAIGPIAMAIAGLIKVFAGLRAAFFAFGVAMEFTGTVMLAFPILGQIVALGLLYYEFQRMIYKLYELTPAQKAVNDVMIQGRQNTIDERVQIEQLLKVMNSDLASKEMKAGAIAKLNAISPEYLGWITQESIATDKATKSIDNYIKKLEEKAIYQEALKKQEEILKNRIQLVMNPGSAKDPNASWLDYLVHLEHSKDMQTIFAKEELKSLSDQYDALGKITREYELQEDLLLRFSKIQISDKPSMMIDAKFFSATEMLSKQLGVIWDKVTGTDRTSNKDPMGIWKLTADAAENTRKRLEAAAKAAKDWWDAYAGEDVKGKLSMLMKKMEEASGKELELLAKKWLALDRIQKKQEDLINQAIYAAMIAADPTRNGVSYKSIAPIGPPKSVSPPDRLYTLSGPYGDKVDNSYDTKKLMTTTLLTEEQRKQLALAGIAADKEAKNWQRWDAQQEMRRSSFAFINKQIQQYGQATNDLLNSYSALVDNKKQKEYAWIDKIAKAQHKSDAWVAKEKSKIDAQYAKDFKAMAIATAIINGALAITNIWANTIDPTGIYKGILTGLSVANTAMQLAVIQGAKMAKGGTVPPGYKNDTYPAWLSSGETVLPAGKLPNITNSNQAFKTVKFRIEGRELVGVLEEMGKLQHSY